MLQIDIPNARLMDNNAEEPFSELRGRRAYCKGLGLSGKAFRECKAGLRQEDKGLSNAEKKAIAAERKGGNYTSPAGEPAGDDWNTDDYVDDTGDRGVNDGTYEGDPSSDAKDYGGDDRIMGMEKSVAIPIIAVSLLAVGIGGFFLVRKLMK